MIEDLRGGLARVAEGVVDMNAKFDRQREENERARREDRAFFTSLLQEVKGRVDDHETRITRLESARAWQLPLWCRRLESLLRQLAELGALDELL